MFQSQLRTKCQQSPYIQKIMEKLDGSCMKVNFNRFLTLIVKKRVEKNKRKKKYLIKQNGNR